MRRFPAPRPSPPPRTWRRRGTAAGCPASRRAACPCRHRSPAESGDPGGELRRTAGRLMAPFAVPGRSLLSGSERMTGWVRQVLERYGQKVTVQTGETHGGPCGRFCSRCRSGSEQAREEATPIGWVDVRLWLYLGQMALEEADTLGWNGCDLPGAQLQTLLCRRQAVPLLGGPGAGTGGGGMRELNQIRDAVVTALAGGGAVRRWRLSGPAGQAVRRPGGGGGRGHGGEPDRGILQLSGRGLRPGDGDTVRELYGKQLEAVISVEIRGQRAADCETGLRNGGGGAAGRTARRHPPRGAELGGPVLGAGDGGLFLRRGRLQCRA